MIKTVILRAGQEAEIEISGGCHCCIENRGEDVIYASKKAGIVADSDGVIAIDSMSAKVLRNVAVYKNSDNSEYDYSGKIYILSSSDGKAEIQAANDLLFFEFKNTSKGGGNGSYDDAKIKAEISALKTDVSELQEMKSEFITNYEIDEILES